MTPTVSRFLIAAIAAIVAGAPTAASQQPAQTAPSGTISGSVIDARTAAPLAHAIATLTLADGGGLLVDPRGGTSSFAIARTVTTSAAGTYRFTDLPIGAYRLRIQRMGYEPATIDVRLGDTGTSPVSVGLVVLPVRLRAMEVHAHDAAGLPGTVSAEAGDDARIAAARARQQAFLSTDARELTLADVAESATVGGSDVLRALERLPGVTPLDDWSAELWVRGNRWSQNRIYYDGLPLFDPLGVLGRTSGVSADAIGGAFLHPGVRPVSLGGEGATRIDLRSRPASAGGVWRGAAEVTQFGATGAIEKAAADTSVGFLVTAHHSLGRVVPDGFLSDALAGRTYDDAGATARGDVELGGGRRLETSGLYADDARTFRSDFDPNWANQRWTNAVGRTTLVTPMGAWAASQTIGVSHFVSRADRWISPTSDSIVARPATSTIDSLTLAGRFAPRNGGTDVTTAGYDIVGQRSSFIGTYASIIWGGPSLALATRRASLGYASAWIDNRTAISSGVTLESGLRLDVGGGRGLDAVRPAGSAQAAFALAPGTRLAIGASRDHQYMQGIDVPVIGQGQTLPTSWITSGSGIPVMSIDNAMAGVEHWLGTNTLLAANAYVRHTTGMIAADPAPGPVVPRPLFVDASESAQGVELSARKLAGRATGVVSYSYAHAVMNARGLSFTAPADRTHALDAALFFHAAGFALGGAYALTSGAPYTRTVVPAALPASPPGTPQVAARLAPNAQRLPAYASLDVSADYTRTLGRVALMAFAGAQNVLGRKNATWYEISGYCDYSQAQPVASPLCRDHDLLETPVKLAPTVGLRVVVR